MPDTRTGPRRSRAIPATVAVLCAASLLLLASLALALAGGVARGEPAPARALEVLAAPGRFLLDAFSWAAFFVPAYLLAGAVLLLVREFRRRSVLVLVLSILPFLTSSLILHVLGSSDAYLSRIMLGAFGPLASAALLFLLLALELMLLFTLPRGSGRSAGESPDGTGAAHGLAAGGAEPTPAVLRLGSRGAALLEPEEAADLPVVVDEETVAPARPVAADMEDIAELEAVDEAENGTADGTEGAAAASSAPAGGQAELDLGAEARRKPYVIPVDGVLKRRSTHDYGIVDEATRHAADVLTAALNEFNIQAEVTGIRKGPVITLYEMLPAPGVRVSKIANLADNIALRLAAPSVRIVAPIPGKHAVGIEVPNRERAIVSFREMVDLAEMQDARHEIPIALGKDILGNAQVIDLVQTPHLLIGGATNSGKSVLVNAIICSILFRRSPEEVRLFLVDPKIIELKSYNGVPHLFTPVITDPRKAFQMLQWCISEMERRYVLLDALGARDIRVYNRKAKKQRVSRLPYIVVVIDEFADLMATTGKELESTLARLAAMARAIGIHLVLATQRPSIDVITGLIKANIPSRIAFMVANKFDDRIIVDGVGAEKLLGRGDMLFSAAWNPFPVRIQGAFVDDEEIENITGHLKKKYGEPQYIDDEVFIEDEEAGDFEGEAGNDPLFERALEIVVSQGKASASYIQRRLKIGYNRSARLVEEMEQRGIVGPAQGSKPREIIHIPKGGACPRAADSPELLMTTVAVLAMHGVPPRDFPARRTGRVLRPARPHRGGRARHGARPDAALPRPRGAPAGVAPHAGQRPVPRGVDGPRRPSRPRHGLRGDRRVQRVLRTVARRGVRIRGVGRGGQGDRRHSDADAGRRARRAGHPRGRRPRADGAPGGGVRLRVAVRGRGGHPPPRGAGPPVRRLITAGIHALGHARTAGATGSRIRSASRPRPAASSA